MTGAMRERDDLIPSPDHVPGSTFCQVESGSKRVIALRERGGATTQVLLVHHAVVTSR